MKIIVIGLRGFPGVQGGVEMHCQHLFPLVASHGHQVEVLARRPYVPKKRYIFKGVSVVALPSVKHKTLEAFCHTFIAVIYARFRNPDVLHIQAIGPSVFTMLARFIGLKVVVTTHGSNYCHLKWNRFEKMFLRFCEYIGIIFANDIIAITQKIGNEVRDKYKRTAKIIPNGVVMPKEIKTKKILREYDLDEQKYVLAVSRFVPEKGLHDLVEAYKRIDCPGFKLVIAGDADHKTEYSQRLKEKAKEAGVVLTGFITGNPLEELFSNAGLFVLPSYYEGLPIALLEALSFGLPVLVSNILPNREIALPDFRYFKLGNTEELSLKMRDLIKKGISREERLFYERILSNDYDWDEIARSTLEVYNGVVGVGGGQMKKKVYS